MSGGVRAFIRLVILVPTVVLALIQPAYSQTSTATLIGVIRDSTNAVLPGVTVTVTSTARNTSQSAISNDVGSYVFPALLPGTYSIAAELPGFKKFVREDITL